MQQYEYDMYSRVLLLDSTFMFSDFLYFCFVINISFFAPKGLFPALLVIKQFDSLTVQFNKTIYLNLKNTKTHDLLCTQFIFAELQTILSYKFFITETQHISGISAV